MNLASAAGGMTGRMGYVFLVAEQRAIFMSGEASKYPIFSWRRRQNNTALAKQSQAINKAVVFIHRTVGRSNYFW